MRMPKYLSPSSISKFENDRTTFYIRYLCDHKTPRPAQKDFMSVGSAFDAFVKHQIHRDIFGEGATTGGQYDRVKIFENQVEEHNRDLASERGEDLFQQYIESGAYGALLADIANSPYAPEMEFTVQADVGGVPLLGKPDLRYITKDGVHVICDWKVNGSTSKTGASPFKGYSIARDVYGSNTNGKCHKAFSPITYKDVIHDSTHLETRCDYWADQLAIYSWLLGEKVGSEEFVVRMEQIACRPVKTRDLPRAKFATHMNKIGEVYQNEVLARASQCWATIKNGHIFTELTREDSDERCELLDGRSAMPVGLHPILDKYKEEETRFK